MVRPTGRAGSQLAAKTCMRRFLLGLAVALVASYPEDAHTRDYCFHIIHNSNGNKCLFIGNWLNYAISIQLSTVQL